MGTFLSITSDSRYADSFENTVKQNKVLRYITHNLSNMMWQESISNKLQKIDKHHTSLSILLRLFDIKNIEKGKLKSYARYSKKEDELEIEQMLALNEYLNLTEDEMRNKLCDDVFIYVKEMLIKYKKRFPDFDSIAFIPLLEERIKRIKNQEFEDNFYETPYYAMLKRAEEMRKNLEKHGRIE